MLFLCTNYNFSGCVKKGTNLVIRADSKIFDRRFKIANLTIYSKVGAAYYFTLSKINKLKPLK